jgi:hypothetical protein
MVLAIVGFVENKSHDWGVDPDDFGPSLRSPTLVMCRERVLFSPA